MAEDRTEIDRIDGPWWRAARKGAGLSVADAADIVGVSAPTIYSMEAGDRPPPLDRAGVMLRTYGYEAVVQPMGAADDAPALAVAIKAAVDAMEAAGYSVEMDGTPLGFTLTATHGGGQ